MRCVLLCFETLLDWHDRTRKHIFNAQRLSCFIVLDGKKMQKVIYNFYNLAEVESLALIKYTCIMSF